MSIRSRIISAVPLPLAAFVVVCVNQFESFWGYHAPMSETFSTLLATFLKMGWIALIFNEVRGAVMAVPVLYGMYQAGGSWMALWVGFCSLVGIALSVALPLVAARKVQKFADQKVFKVSARPAPASAG